MMVWKAMCSYPGNNYIVPLGLIYKDSSHHSSSTTLCFSSHVTNPYFCAESFIFLGHHNVSQSRAKTPELLERISASELDPKPWRFTNIGLGLPHAQSFSVCLSS